MRFRWRVAPALALIGLVACPLLPGVTTAAQESITSYETLARVYERRKQYDLAIAYWSNSIELDPKYSQTYHRRGLVFQIKGDFERAIADYSKAMQLDPKDYRYPRSLGLAKYDAGDFEGAAVALLRSLELRAPELPVDAFALLYRYLARSRAGDTAAAEELQANARRLKTTEWPYPVFEHYLGLRSPQATLDIARKYEQDRCTAHFYVGQWHILKGNTTEAQTALQYVVDSCSPGFSEHKSAIADLKRLKQ
jgi:lipoprotein NlpI